MRETIKALKTERDTLAGRVDNLNKAIALLEGDKPARKAAKKAALTVDVPPRTSMTDRAPRARASFAEHLAEHARAAAMVTPPESQPLSRDRILRHLATAGRQTTAEIVDALCMARGPVAGAMTALYLAGKVERTTVRNPDARTRAPSLVYAWAVKA